MTTLTGKKVYLAWGLLDAFYVLWYAITALMAGSTPFMTDLLNAQQAYRNWSESDVFSVWAAVPTFVMFSILISAILFLSNSRFAHYLGWIQIPFRIFLLMPSISVLILLATMLASSMMPVMVILVLVSEAIKAWSLWKYR